MTRAKGSHQSPGASVVGGRDGDRRRDGGTGPRKYPLLPYREPYDCTAYPYGPPPRTFVVRFHVRRFET
jgi:hypothetical protein